ncbi:hypothetical protein [Sphingomicrobium sediminis]|uniref:Uncharacterized protein n=1 Tax=Sphingomicrobium sediminis TaxID=2950949 RepID=A0A9X2EGP8_9SPHN|nr:hypothetical protein [Sphingomicrobium sediminis]MCM8556351.1 hypothetical protein [Sphingomicrobium sediminis]
MIYKRFVANLRAQNWFAISVELVIVVVGVFLGTMVANWNEEQGKKRETARLLQQLRPELEDLLVGYQSIIDYYAITRAYGDTAFAAWRGEGDYNDTEFVIAAFMASQHTYVGYDANAWSTIFGNEQLRRVENPELRAYLIVIMSTKNVSEQELFTDYRQNVRRIIPEDLQDMITQECGDRRMDSAQGWVTISEECTLDLPDDKTRRAARRLKENPVLADEMRWHFAAIAAYQSDLVLYQRNARRVVDLLKTELE